MVEFESVLGARGTRQNELPADGRLDELSEGHQCSVEVSGADSARRNQAVEPCSIFKVGVELDGLLFQVLGFQPAFDAAPREPDVDVVDRNMLRLCNVAQEDPPHQSLGLVEPFRFECLAYRRKERPELVVGQCTLFPGIIEEFDWYSRPPLTGSKIPWLFLPADSDGFRTPVPIDSVQRFRSFRTP